MAVMSVDVGDDRVQSNQIFGGVQVNETELKGGTDR
jgi:hypothetical protein